MQKLSLSLHLATSISRQYVPIPYNRKLSILALSISGLKTFIAPSLESLPFSACSTLFSTKAPPDEIRESKLGAGPVELMGDLQALTSLKLLQGTCHDQIWAQLKVRAGKRKFRGRSGQSPGLKGGHSYPASFPTSAMYLGSSLKSTNPSLSIRVRIRRQI